jgi:ADP-ribose pyrophosphatase YjhB (NUDIX family)
MYKVFMNDCPIILTDFLPKNPVGRVLDFKEASLEIMLSLLEDNPKKGLCLYASNLESAWATFKTWFRMLEAAGGMVLNAKEETLFIYRFDKWDLPKGHLEKGEHKTAAALREVEEECGVQGLCIERELQTTYHIFKYKSELRLKVTYWFLMRTTHNAALVPQKEEGIQKAVFKNKRETAVALENTYANIKLLFPPI